MEFSEINDSLLDVIKKTPPNTITHLGDYPKRERVKKSESKFKLNESKLSLMSILES
jgi:protein-arginine kinase activator protein McsA